MTTCVPEAAVPPAAGTLGRLLHAAAPTVAGRVTRAVGLSVDVAGLDLGVGEAVQLDGDTGPILAEVVALHDEVATCMPVSDLRGVRRGSRVVATGGPLMVPIGPGLLGRVVDALGRPMDGGPPLRDVVPTGVDGIPPVAMSGPGSTRRWAWACGPSTRWCRADAASASASSPARASGKSSTAVDDHPRHRRADLRPRAGR